MKISEFIQKALSESGDISFGRLASGVCLASVLTWDSAYVAFCMRHFTQLKVEDLLPSSTNLAAQAMFCATFYGINKFKSTVDNAVSK